jgi:hypothetical protein
MMLAWPCGLQAGSMNVPRTPTPSHQEIVISRVTPETITIELKMVSATGRVEEKRSKTFTVTKFTEITVNGRKGTATDLKAGMRVNITAGTDRTVAARIDANG